VLVAHRAFVERLRELVDEKITLGFVSREGQLARNVHDAICLTQLWGSLVAIG